ncbi:hypothetical protein ES705_22163 [subsurface metagenome]|jgi:branched-chain amino acid transport system substrate-binding protein
MISIRDFKIRWLRIISLLLILVIVISIFGIGLAKTPNKIKIGLMFGLTGAASPIGPVQRDGAILAIEEINKNGGVNLGGKKILVEYIVRDDETKPDIALRRFREFIYDEKVDVIVGQTFASISAVLNEEVKKLPIAYFPVNVVPLGMFKKETLADTVFAIHGSAYAAGYASAAYIIKELGYKNIMFFGPAYAFGKDQWEGAKDAIEKYGGECSYIESPVGTTDYTSYLIRIREKHPDIVMLAHWGNDAINVLKQTYETGLKEEIPIWFNWMTNVFGKGVPPQALDGVYSLMSWYWDMEGFGDEEIVKAAEEFSIKFKNRYGYQPDPYSAMAYLGVKEAIRGIELAQSTNSLAIAEALMKNPEFDSMKGPGKWRIDHQPVFRYGAFVVKGKAPDERKGEWDLVKILGAYSGEDYLPSLEKLGY